MIPAVLTLRRSSPQSGTQGDGMYVAVAAREHGVTLPGWARPQKITPQLSHPCLSPRAHARNRDGRTKDTNERGARRPGVL